MDQPYSTGKTFERLQSLEKGEYEHCHFISCDLSEADLSGFHFTECVFNECNLGLAKLTKTAFRDVRFKDCKLLGLHFEHCNEFLLSFFFEDCILNLSSFYKLKLKKTMFKNCSLREADLTEADLSGSVFDNCDLAGAVFDHTVLEKADLRTAYHYSINPDKNRLKKARFAAAGLAGLLHQYDIEIE